MEAGEYGLTRGTWFFARSLEVVAVAGLMWVSGCVLGGAGFFLVLQVNTFSNSYIQSSPRRLGEGVPIASQSAHKRSRAHLSPPGVPFSVLAPEKYFEHGVISSSVS